MELLVILGFLNSQRNENKRARLKEKKDHIPSSIEFTVENSTLEKLGAFSQTASLTMGEAAIMAIQKGMANYRLMFYISLKKEYESLMENYEKCMRDNELLSALEKQNEDLNALLRGQEHSLGRGEGITNG